MSYHCANTVRIPDLFPSLPEGQNPTALQAAVLVLSQEIDVPFPAEPNVQYSNWWRSLHEIAHWAVKPYWYNTAEFGASTIPIMEGIPDEEVRALVGTGLHKTVSYYRAGNDIIPTLGMLNDPTPSEPEVRAWSITMMVRRQWEHPFRTILRERISPQEMAAKGDDGWHKTSTAQVWAPTSVLNEDAVHKMAQFGVNPLLDLHRPVDTSFMPPHHVVESLDHLSQNYSSINKAYYPISRAKPYIPEATILGERYWNIYLQWKRFTSADASAEHYDRMLEGFDNIQSTSLELFKEAWFDTAQRYGHGSLAACAASLVRMQEQCEQPAVDIPNDARRDPAKRDDGHGAGLPAQEQIFH